LILNNLYYQYNLLFQILSLAVR